MENIIGTKVSIVVIIVTQLNARIIKNVKNAYLRENWIVGMVIVFVVRFFLIPPRPIDQWLDLVQDN
jgi:hypothetical protein